MKTTELTKTKHRSRRLRRFGRATEAVSALEYAILIGVVSIVLVAAVGSFGGKIEDALEKVGDNVKTKHTSVGS